MDSMGRELILYVCINTNDAPPYINTDDAPPYIHIKTNDTPGWLHQYPRVTGLVLGTFCNASKDGHPLSLPPLHTPLRLGQIWKRALI